MQEGDALSEAAGTVVLLTPSSPCSASSASWSTSDERACMVDEKKDGPEPTSAALEATKPRSEPTKALTPREQPRRKPSVEKKRIGKGQSPTRTAKSVENSFTSPKRIIRQKRKAEALSLRASGYTFAEIAKHMHTVPSIVHGYVVEALKEIPQENAVEVLRLELQRLDGLLAAHSDAAFNGDLPSGDMLLKIHDRRAKLLGLLPDRSQVGMAVNVSGGGDDTPMVEIQFVLPDPQPQLEPRDVTPPSRPRASADPVVIEGSVAPPTSVPIAGKRKGFNWS
jgi:hypothetical protein